MQDISKIHGSDICTRRENLLRKIIKSATESKRDPADITLTAVSKTIEQQAILPLLASGQRIFGENKVQEAKMKWPKLRSQFHDIELHLIGPLQSNKVSEAVALFDVIETIDRDKIAALLAQESRRQNKNLQFYIQINIGSETQKSGIPPQEALDFIRHCQNQHQLNIKGLMCIPPLNQNPGPYFALLNKIGSEAGLSHLSMGMSNDFETAIAFGATNIRIKTALFEENN